MSRVQLNEIKTRAKLLSRRLCRSSDAWAGPPPARALRSRSNRTTRGIGDGGAEASCSLHQSSRGVRVRRCRSTRPVLRGERGSAGRAAAVHSSRPGVASTPPSGGRRRACSGRATGSKIGSGPTNWLARGGSREKKLLLGPTPGTGSLRRPGRGQPN